MWGAPIWRFARYYRRFQMSRIIVNRFALGVLLSLAGLLSSCSSGARRDALLAAVPRNAVMVKVVDLEALCADAGCSLPSRGGSLSGLTEALAGYAVEPGLRGAFAEVVEAGVGNVDFSAVVTFTSSAGRDVALMGVAGRGALLNGLLRRLPAVDGDAPELAADDGFEFLPVGGAVVAVRDGICFIAHDIIDIKDAMAHSRSAHIGSVPGIVEFLESGSPAAVAVNCARSPLGFLGGDSRWLCVGIDATDREVRARARVLSDVGGVDSIGARFSTVDPDVLRFIPDDVSVLVSFGRFTGNQRALALLLGRFTPAYMPQADGSTVLFAMPVGSPDDVAAGRPGAWSVETVVHLPAAVADSCVAVYRASAPADVSEVAPDRFSYSVDGTQYCFGKFGDYVAFASGRSVADNYGGEAYGRMLKDKRAVMMVSAPAGSVLARAWRLSGGMSFSLVVEADAVEGRVVVDGDSRPALAVLLSLERFPDIYERFRADTGR